LTILKYYNKHSDNGKFRGEAMTLHKKESVLKAAESLFSTKGFNTTKVSDIAKKSGIHEASIYSYFNNKKNILFAIYGKYVEGAVNDLNQHFLGMKEPGPMLRKSIWHYLADIRSNPNYARILMEAQRDPGFYSSEYDTYLKEFSDLVAGVIISGQDEGFFRTDINARLIKNIALGTCVHTGFNHTVFRHDYDPNEMSDIIFQLVVNATGNREYSHIENNERIKKGEREEFRKNQIINAALKVFSLKGFSSTTISDIAGEAKLGEATLYEYFNSKKDILLSISESYMKDFLSREVPPLSGHSLAEVAMRKLIWQWVWQLYSNENFSRLLVLDLLRNINYYSDPKYEHHKIFREKILDTVEQGRQEGVFIKDFPPLTYFHMVIGTFDQFLLGQFLLDRPPLGISELNDAVDTLLRAIKIQRS
jgi:TetR/AcrR family fatty acid metabolism transcriptional regulator